MFSEGVAGDRALIILIAIEGRPNLSHLAPQNSTSNYTGPYIRISFKAKTRAERNRTSLAALGPSIRAGGGFRVLFFEHLFPPSS